jgi:hypothetical protein
MDVAASSGRARADSDADPTVVLASDGVTYSIPLEIARGPDDAPLHPAAGVSIGALDSTAATALAPAPRYINLVPTRYINLVPSNGSTVPGTAACTAPPHVPAGPADPHSTLTGKGPTYAALDASQVYGAVATSTAAAPAYSTLHRESQEPEYC